MKRSAAVLAGIVCLFMLSGSSFGRDYGWYTEGNFEPMKRIKITLTNPLDIDRQNCPVIIKRSELPYQNIAQRNITVVDPEGPPNPAPTDDELRRFSGYLIREEAHGHFMEYQMDDLDKDGLWDELLIMIDLKARETKTIYLYVQKAERGLYKHKTHAGIGYYGRHMVPFWEAEHVGWKLWFPTSVDLHGKREPMLTAYPEYAENLSGYYMPWEYGTDIMRVGSTFGNGGIGLFECTAVPDSVSRPQYDYNTGEGPFEAPRFAFDVVVNGPLRSMICAKTMNWNTGAGRYELKQYYTAYANESYSTCKVEFTTFLPPDASTAFCCGIREIMDEYTTYQKEGTVISFGKDIEVRIPDEDIGDEGLMVDFEGIALVVKDCYNPEYVNIEGQGGNHTFKVPVSDDLSFEYMIFGAWSSGAVNRTEQEFREYVVNTALEYNNPVEVEAFNLEQKEVESQ